jgi:hypothetical protein
LIDNANHRIAMSNHRWGVQLNAPAMILADDAMRAAVFSAGTLKKAMDR